MSLAKVQLSLFCVLSFILLPAYAVDAFTPPNLGPRPKGIVKVVVQEESGRILRLARQALALPPITITDWVVTNTPGSVHDYFSQADYAWPNPSGQDGVPFVIRDGDSNPTAFSFHRLALRQMKDAVAALAAAYAVTGENCYVAKAAELLRVFFLEPATRMNPNLRFAQGIPGKAWGTPYGIIDTLHLAEAAMANRVLERSPAFPAGVDEGLKRWFQEYTHWILTSENGRLEMQSPNNHIIACFLQLASFAKLTGDEEVLDLARREFKEVLLPDQMANNGSFTRELARTKPFGYSLFQADNLAALCTLLSSTNEDYWQYTLPDGRTPRMAIDFIYPYVADKNQWLIDGRGRDVMHWESWPVRQPGLLLAYAEFGDQKYFNLWRTLNPDPTDLEVRRNAAITQPLLWIIQPSEVPLFPMVND